MTLITRRSEVRILPPLLKKAAHGAAFFNVAIEQLSRKEGKEEATN